MSKLAIQGGPAVRSTPFPAWPVFGPEEEKGLLEVLHSRVWGGYHPFVEAFEKRWAAYCGSEDAVLACNGSQTMGAALLALGVEPGDEVIVPPLSFIATATAVSLIGAVPVFADVDAATLNLDPQALEAAITPRTAAVMPVHFAGVPADMDRIRSAAERHALAVVEDAAHAHGSEWRGRRAGSLGDMASFSFQNTKVMTAGEGGAVTGPAETVEKVRRYFNHGRRRGRGWFEHFDPATNGRISGFQAAVLLAQLDRLDAQIERRTGNARLLTAGLSDIPGVSTLAAPPQVTRHAHYLLLFRLDSQAWGAEPAQILAALRAEGIPVDAYPYPLYRNPVFEKLRHRVTPCPEAQRSIESTAWIPGPVLLGDSSDIADVVSAFEKVYQARGELARFEMEGRSG